MIDEPNSLFPNGLLQDATVGLAGGREGNDDDRGSFQGKAL